MALLISDPHENASMLLREATAKKDNGEIDDAVIMLRQAYSEIAKTDIEFPIETFLRLPLYLQAAKKPDEAWKEFKSLLVDGYPNQPNAPGTKGYDRSKIYDKMRLFLQREGKNMQAVEYGILSYLLGLYGRYVGRDYDDYSKAQYEEYCSEETYEKIVLKLLKKAGKEDRSAMICSIVGDYVLGIPDKDIGRTRKLIIDALNI